MWQPDSYLKKLYEETIEAHRTAAGSASREKRERQLREALRRAIGDFERSSNAAPKELERVDCGDHIRERVELQGVDGSSFAAYVLVPKGAAGPMPGALAIHGHGYGSREIVGLAPDGSPDRGEPSGHRHFALELVRRGMIVIAPDVVGFGERRLALDADKDPRGNSSCYALASHLLLYGKTLTGFRAAELLAALDYFAGREDVDAARIGALGFSGGALLAWVCASLDERLRAVVLTGFPGTFKGTIMSVHHCIDNYTPGLLREAELPEWIGLLAPRALFVESGSDDPIFPVESAREAIRRLEARYGEAGVPERFASDVFPGSHEVSGRRAYDWLAGSLKG